MIALALWLGCPVAAASSPPPRARCIKIRVRQSLPATLTEAVSGRRPREIVTDGCSGEFCCRCGSKWSGKQKPLTELTSEAAKVRKLLFGLYVFCDARQTDRMAE